ncbi:hypothetical protein C3731_02750 [Brucella oryzae]|uniref:Uncharacterized protein n=1 Tax=Brucella oryzae TaxID=335286 RepID=A0A2S7J4I2_9HYPH|nr:hypothetical protein [Brucella oryzae]PQA75154.1 hypothetical protein C3731_02750 [Brucella oryzae]
MSIAMMKAIRLHEFGGPEVLRYEDRRSSRGVYNKAEYEVQCRHMMQKWADTLAGLRVYFPATAAADLGENRAIQRREKSRSLRTSMAVRLPC